MSGTQLIIITRQTVGCLGESLEEAHTGSKRGIIRVRMQVLHPLLVDGGGAVASPLIAGIDDGGIQDRQVCRRESIIEMREVNVVPICLYGFARHSQPYIQFIAYVGNHAQLR